MTEEYISKKEIDRDFELFIDNVPQDQKAFVYVFKSRLDMMLTADVKPVIHAHWVPIPHSRSNCRCSHCKAKYEVYGGLIGNYYYCPSCGAIMDEEVNE